MSFTKIILAAVMLATLPSSATYQLNSYGFGSGGTANSTSSNYAINGLSGETAGQSASSDYKVGAGENFLKQANVPTATLTNDGYWYNKLHLTISSANNPSDATFAVAISTDNFATTQYVKSDFTVGSTLTSGDRLTYAGWGGSSGIIVRGLSDSSVYTVKVKAYRGKFTESPYGPTSAGTTTLDPQLSFDIDVSATDTSTSPPYEIDFGNLLVSTVTDSPQRVWVSLDTNGESGGTVYLSSLNTGLKSPTDNYTITSSTANLSSQAEGFGVQGVSATQTSGGPLTISSPYNGSGANVGIADATIRQIFAATAPIIAGRASFILKAKTKPLTPAAVDYSETLTAIASASF